MENLCSSVTCLGLDDSTVVSGWDLARDGPKKEEDSCSGIVQSIGPNPNPNPNPCVPMKKLLVLDLNGLLADIVFPPAGYKPDIVIGRRAIFKRPFCEDFLKFCFQNFQVGIWSSRKQSNVERITEFLLGDMKSKLLFCWDMSFCNVGFKDLNKLSQNFRGKPAIIIKRTRFWLMILLTRLCLIHHIQRYSLTRTIIRTIQIHP